MVPGVPVDIAPGAPVAQLCDASVTGVLAAGIPAPPAQAGGTDIGPMDDPVPAAAKTGAAPIPPAPSPAGPTSEARADPRPPVMSEAVAGPASEVSRPPPPRPIKSDSAEAKLPTSFSPMLLWKAPDGPKGPVLPRKAVSLLMALMSPPPGAALDAAPDAPDSELAAVPAWLAA